MKKISGVTILIGICVFIIGAFWFGWESYNSVRLNELNIKALGLCIIGQYLIFIGFIISTIKGE